LVLSLYTADPEADPFDVDTIRAANPAFGDFQNADEVLAMAEDARRMPSREAEFRNLILNQRVETSNPFITKSVWAGCGALPRDDFRGLPVYGGLDLSEVRDLTACVLLAPVDGVWQVQPSFWLPGQGLRERARADRVPYDLWASQGYLHAIEGASSVEYEFVAAYLRDVFDTMDVRKFAFDRWNFRHLKPWLLKVGFDERSWKRSLSSSGRAFKA
jgi:phage terminase large subunit-like protein